MIQGPSSQNTQSPFLRFQQAVQGSINYPDFLAKAVNVLKDFNTTIYVSLDHPKKLASAIFEPIRENIVENEIQKSHKKQKLEAEKSAEVFLLLAILSPQFYEDYKKDPEKQKLFEDPLALPLKSRLIQFIRTGRADFGENLLQVLFLAKKYEMHDLKNYCIEKIVRYCEHYVARHDFDAIHNFFNFSKYSSDICHSLAKSYTKILNLFLNEVLKENDLAGVHFWSLYVLNSKIPPSMVESIVSMVESQVKIQNEIKDEAKRDIGWDYLACLMRMYKAKVPLNFLTITNDQNNPYEELGVQIESKTHVEGMIPDIERLYTQMQMDTLTFFNDVRDQRMKLTSSMLACAEKILPHVHTLNVIDCVISDEIISIIQKGSGSKLVGVNFNQSHFTNNQISELFKGLGSQCSQLEEFHFSGVVVENSADQAVIQWEQDFESMIRQRSKLKSVDLSDSKFMESVLPRVFASLKNHPSISFLSLSNLNDLNPYVYHIYDLLSSNKVKSLEIAHNKLTSANIQLILKKAQHLTLLNLSNNQIDEECAKGIRDWVSESKNLKELKLCDVGMKRDRLNVILDGVAEGVIEHLSLNGNPFGAEEMSILAKFLSQTYDRGYYAALKTLDLRGIKMESRSIQLLSNGIKENDTIKTILISESLISDDTPNDILDGLDERIVFKVEE